MKSPILNDYPKVDTLHLRYKSVNLGAEQDLFLALLLIYERRCNPFQEVGGIGAA